MGINVIVQYNGGFLPDILLFIPKPLLSYGSMAFLSYINATLLFMHFIDFCFVLFGGPALHLR